MTWLRIQANTDKQIVQGLTAGGFLWQSRSSRFDLQLRDQPFIFGLMELELGGSQP